MAQLQPRRKLIEKALQQPALIPSTSVVQDQIVSEQQSFAMVQRTLQTSVGILAFLRCLLPERCYDWVDYSSIHGKPSSAPLGTLQKKSSETEVRRQRNRPCRRAGYRVIARSRTKSGDTLLDWLDIISDGIHKKSISAIQFSIYTDLDNPSTIIESYRFDVQYAPTPGRASYQIVGMMLVGPNGKSVTVGSAMSRMERIHDCLYNWSNVAPDLPDIRFLTCHLLHTPDYPSDLRPAGFRQCNESTMCIPNTDFWQIKEKEMGVMSSGFHNVSLSVVYMGPKEGAGPDSDGPLEIPQRFPHTKAISRFPNLERSIGAKPANTAKATTLREATTENSAGFRGDSPSSRGKASPEGTMDLDKIIAESTQAGDSVQSSDAGNIDRTTSPWYSSSVDSLILTQKLRPRSQESGVMPALRLVRWKWLEMIAKREALRTARHESSEPKIEHTVRCECGFGREEVDMMQCNCCETWQHGHCYGFVMHVPCDEHFCYRCLFETSDLERLQDLKRLAKFRRAIWLAYQGEYPGSLAKFAKVLRYDKASETEVIRRMKDEGYLVKVKGSQFNRIDTTEQIQKRDRDYSNPTTLLSHLYEITDEGRPSKRIKSS